MSDIYEELNIDKTKLSRDYIQQPLGLIPMATGGFKKEMPLKEDLEYLYIKNNLSVNELARYFGVSTTPIYKWFKEYDIKKDINKISQKRYKTNLERYNDGTFTNRNKAKKTCLEKYGVDNFVESDKFKEKAKQTCLEKYGVTNYAQTNEYKNKTKQTNMEKYGVEWFLQSHSYNDIMSEKYGCSNGFQTIHPKNVYEIMNNRNKLVEFIHDNEIINGYHLAEVMGISKTMANNYLRLYDIHKIFKYHRSTLELEIMKFVSSNVEIIHNDRTVIKPLELDIYIPSKNIAIEINGDYWHDYELFPDTKIRDEKKQGLCEEKGIKLITIWEHDWKENKDEMKKKLLEEINPIKSST